jgi:hypothetical protein
MSFSNDESKPQHFFVPQLLQVRGMTPLDEEGDDEDETPSSPPNHHFALAHSQSR